MEKAALQQVDDLAIMVRRLAQALRKAAPDNDLSGKALDYLNRAELSGAVMRDLQPNA